MPRIRKALVKSLAKEALGQNLRLVRMQKGFTQIDVAVKLSISQNAYSKIELGRTQLTFKTLILISDLFEMDLPELVSQMVSNVAMKL